MTTKNIDLSSMPQMETELILDGEPIIKDNSSSLSLAERCEITSNESNIIAGEMLTNTKALQKEVENGYKDLVSEAHKHHKAVKAKMDSFLKPLKEAESILKEKISEFGADKKHQAKGISLTKKVTGEIIDEDSIPDEFMVSVPNMTAINAILKSGGKVPGVKPINTTSITARIQ